jgi:hypothetical protein
MGVLCTLFFFFWGTWIYFDWPITNVFWNTGHSPIEAPLSTPSGKIETPCLHSPMAYLFSSHTWELNFGQTICDRTEVLLGISCGDNLRTWKNPMGTHWEQGEKPKYNICSHVPMEIFHFYKTKIEPRK